MKSIYIEWEDACYEPGGLSVSDLGSLTKCITFGIFVRETDKIISVALEYRPGDDEYVHICHIPKAWITKMEKMER